jgi:hypothetical protein
MNKNKFSQIILLKKNDSSNGIKQLVIPLTDSIPNDESDLQIKGVQFIQENSMLTSLLLYKIEINFFS